MEPAQRPAAERGHRPATERAGPGNGQESRALRQLSKAIERRLERRVVGQPEALQCVARAVRRAAAGLGRGRGPLASLFFVGPTGTGKTELARALAEELGGRERLIRIDCGEFGTRHEASKLLGAPPGYVGHEHGGLFVRRLHPGRESVVLFDEIEKAHPQLHELLLAVLDEGSLTDGRGLRADFRRSIVILTSNTGTRELLAAGDRLGFGRAAPGTTAEAEIVARALGQAFAPEFLGRLDEVVLFRQLTAGDARTIATRELTELARRVRARGRRVCFSPAVARWAVAHGFANSSGARGIAHCLRREIESPLAEALLASQPLEWIEVSIRRGRPHFVHAA